MRHIRFLLVAALTVWAAVLSCAPSLGAPTSRDADWAARVWPDTNLESLKKGRELYVQRCAGCHNLYRPGEYPADRWPALVEDMADEARLAPDGQELILRYLMTMSASGRGTR